MIGRILGGRYEITGPLGEGGMARVFRARRLADGRLVAIKVLREQYAHDKEFVARFEPTRKRSMQDGPPPCIQSHRCNLTNQLVPECKLRAGIGLGDQVER